MEKNKRGALRYELVVKEPLIDKFIPRGGSISRHLMPPLHRITDPILRRKVTDVPNQEVWRAHQENWLNFGVRVIGGYLGIDNVDAKVDMLSSEPLSSFATQELLSGVTKITAQAEKRELTCFIAPPGTVPYSLRAMDIFPKIGEDIPVSASLREIAKSWEIEQTVPALALTAAGWARTVLFGDEIYLKTLDGDSTEEHVKQHIKETAMSIDTRSNATYFTLDDFFAMLDNPPLVNVPKVDNTTKTPYLPGMEAHWLVTDKNGIMQVMSASELRFANQRHNLRETVSSIASIVGYVDDTIVANYAQYENLLTQRVNAVVLFGLDGEQRIGSIHGEIETNVLNMHELAKRMICAQYPEAEDIAIGVLDGGGSSGAIVLDRKEQQVSFDVSTLPGLVETHEIPTYIAFVPKNFVTQNS